MMRLVEGLVFAGLALVIHLVAFAAGEPETAAVSRGQEGSELVSLEASSASVEAMVEEWERPPELPVTDAPTPPGPQEASAPPDPQIVPAPEPSPEPPDAAGPPPEASASETAAEEPATPDQALGNLPSLSRSLQGPAAPEPPQEPTPPEASESAASEAEASETEPSRMAARRPEQPRPEPSVAAEEPSPEAAAKPPRTVVRRPKPAESAQAEKTPTESAVESLPPAVPTPELSEPEAEPTSPPTSARPVARPEPPAQRRPDPAESSQTAAERQPARDSRSSKQQRAAGAGGGPAAGSHGSAASATLSRAEIRNLKAQWGATIRARVERRKRSPRAAGRSSGTVTVAITVARDGRLVDVALLRSSGSSALDRAAVQAVRRAGRFPSAPRGLTEAAFRFSLPMSFRR